MDADADSCSLPSCCPLVVREGDAVAEDSDGGDDDTVGDDDDDDEDAEEGEVTSAEEPIDRETMNGTTGDKTLDADDAGDTRSCFDISNCDIRRCLTFPVIFTFSFSSGVNRENDKR